jgi:hypothetical protein
MPPRMHMTGASTSIKRTITPWQKIFFKLVVKNKI